MYQQTNLQQQIYHQYAAAGSPANSVNNGGNGHVEILPGQQQMNNQQQVYATASNSQNFVQQPMQADGIVNVQGVQSNSSVQTVQNIQTSSVTNIQSATGIIGTQQQSQQQTQQQSVLVQLQYSANVINSNVPIAQVQQSVNIQQQPMGIQQQQFISNAEVLSIIERTGLVKQDTMESLHSLANDTTIPQEISTGNIGAIPPSGSSSAQPNSSGER